VGPPRQFQDIEEWIYTQVERYRKIRYEPARVEALGEKAAVFRLEEFDVEDREINEAMESVRGKEGLVLDLRDNPGGSVEVLEKLVGCLFDREVRIGERKGRKDAKPLVAKRQPPARVFGGKLVVLVNAASASAAEVTARTVQLERRGTVIGDRTAGAVMVSRQWSYTQGHEYRFLFYGLSITDADLVMSDGRSLEKTGVVPDEVVLPTGEDLASGRDPVLALAAQRVGATLDPEAAGKLFAGTIEGK
jgi:carboxyl-terminal processing protease